MTTTVSGSYPAVNSDSDATINGLTVGKGGGAVASNTSLGYLALNASNSGTGENVGVGYEALKANTTGNRNTAVGLFSAGSNTTGNNNIAIGNSSFQTNTTGGNNVAVGNQALQANTTASNNTAVGYQALYANTTGAGNTAVGQLAGDSITTGADNTCIGKDAGSGLTTPNQNTLIGSFAGYLITTGANNTVLGRYTGNQGGLDIRTSNNNIVLSDGDGNIRYYAGASGSMVFNGVAIPSSAVGGAAFQVAGDGRMQLIQATTSTATRALQEFYNPNGNVGSIGSSGSNAYYSTTSDYRLKENIAPMAGALNKVALLKPCTYTWKNSQEDSQGFIAHELAEVCPQAVIGGKDNVDAEGKPIYQSIDTSFLVATLTAAIQELNAKVEAQALEIAQLKGN